jgi:maltose O-acetyltransferase
MKSMTKLANFKDSSLNVLVRQGLGRRAPWLLLYYLVAAKLPASPLPFSVFGNALRAACVRRIFKSVGTDVTVHANASFGSGVHVQIGNYSSLNANCSISNDTELGADVMLGPDVLILSGSHNFDRTDIPMREQGSPSRRKVVVCDDVWIGARSIILPGVTVGAHSIVGAGSVVTKDVPPWAIVAGNPARLIRFRNGQTVGNKSSISEASLPQALSESDY